eukprot:CAMPEP_0170799046 /NCGR_PEP_ID=MMETSP0733-20121128/26770_1 /TAXON_ID=186038 /ORGANISM="Fragilariopsis kerguelensis, Strain L26-C5" /LENGTH=318 /DNA_ID=CAMNT_0011150619 /DNA_START=104 /DNA_END=1060 /DNA_ORIENTATION=-
MMMEDGGLSSWYTDTSASASDESPMKSLQDSPSPSSNSDGANNHYPPTLIRPAEDWNVVSPSPSYIITGTTVHSSPQQSNNASSSFPGITTISPMSVVEAAADARSSPLPSIPPLSCEHQHQHQHEPPALPTTLGTSMHNYQQKKIHGGTSRHRNNYSTTRTHNNNSHSHSHNSHSHTRFVEKSKLEQQREKIASRRVQSMMMEGCRNAARSRQKAEEKREKHKLLLLPLPHGHYQQHASSFGKREAKLHLLPSGMEYLASSSRSTSTSTSTKERTPPLILEDLTGSVNDFKNGFEKDRERAAQKQAMKMIIRLTNAA